MFFNFGKWYRNFESSGTLLSKFVELWPLSQLYNFAKLQKLPKVQVDVFLMLRSLILELVYISQGGGGMWKRDQHSFFFLESCSTPLPPPTFLIEYVFPMLMFSEIFFYIIFFYYRQLSTALRGVRFIDANNSTLAIRYRHYASWVTNGFRKEGSGVYWWR